MKQAKDISAVQNGHSNMSTIAHAEIKPDLISILACVFAASVVSLTFSFLVNFALLFVWNWPGISTLGAYLGWFGSDQSSVTLTGSELVKSCIQLLIYIGPVFYIIWKRMYSTDAALLGDGKKHSTTAAFIIRAAFWSVLLIGIVDSAISFMRIEGILSPLVGDVITPKLSLSKFRGQYVHIPLILLSVVIAYRTRAVSVVWLSLFIVLAEFQIVLSRFIFSYEQAFMGDLVRFWYSSLYLFASAYCLVDEGHVRVDIFYSHFSKTGKALTNAIGAVVLGVPLCWSILIFGLWGKSSSLSAALLNFEVSQSGYGLYIKYLMAGFLVVFAVSMVAQFMALFLESIATLRSRDKTSDVQVQQLGNVT